MSYVDTVVELFRSKLVEKYSLDEPVVKDICALLGESVTEAGVPAAGKRQRRAGTTRRKKSGYNVYVREKMAEDEEIKQLSHREKMAAIGARWKALTDDEKQEYNDKAQTENDAATEVAAAPAEQA